MYNLNEAIGRELISEPFLILDTMLVWEYNYGQLMKKTVGVYTVFNEVL